MPQWSDHLNRIRSTFPAQWEACKRTPEVFQGAWVAADAAFQRGDLRETADLLIMSAVYEAQRGGKSSTALELVVWAFFYGSVDLFANKSATSENSASIRDVPRFAYGQKKC